MPSAWSSSGRRCARAHAGARAVNYLAASGFAEGRVQLTDRRTQAVLEVQPNIIVNAAGPWIDRVNQALTRPTGYIGGAKGSHVVLDNPELLAQLGEHMIYYGGGDGRVCLVYPFFGHVLLGSTDIPVEDPDSVVCDEDETAYMLSTLREVFPDIAITPNRWSTTTPASVLCRKLMPPIQGQSRATIRCSRTNRPGCAADLLDGRREVDDVPGLRRRDDGFILASLSRKRRHSTEFEPIGGGRGFPQSDRQRADWIAQFSDIWRNPATERDSPRALRQRRASDREIRWKRNFG